MTTEDKSTAQEAYQEARDLAGREHGYAHAAFKDGDSSYITFSLLARNPFVCKADAFTGTMLECGEHALEAMERAGQVARTQWLEQHQALS